MTLTFISLFAGIGGMDLGLERAGMECVAQVEIDDYATKVLAKHWPNVTKFRDVRDVGAHNLPVCDLIAGGFPCQDISQAGKRAGLSGERSGLWFEFHRIICELRPRYVLVENVAALRTPIRRAGRFIEPAPISRVLGDLAESGYDAEWDCIPASAVGAPHQRDRVFIVAYSNGQRCRQMEQPVLGGTQAQRATNTIEYSRSTRGGGWWQTEPDVGRVAYGVPDRLDRLRGLGNAVVPQVAEFIGSLIMEHANGTKSS